MTIERFGIFMESLQEKDLELVRMWRNSEVVNQNLINREYITAEQQLSWYSSIQNEQSLYFVISYKNTKAGIIYLTNIDWVNRTFESNIFIGNGIYLDSFVSVYAAIILSDLFFLKLKFTKANSKHFITNNRSAHFDSALGFNFIEKKTANDNMYYKFATPESYLLSTSKLRKALYRNNVQNQNCIIKTNSTLYRNDVEKRILLSLKQQGVELFNGHAELSFPNLNVYAL